jgi:predicted RNA-binding protein with PIN domain
MVPPGDTADGGPVTDALEALDARSFAQLLRALRGLRELPEELATPLARPTSELAGGPARTALCRAIARDARTLAALRADEALPAAVHAAIGRADDDGADDDGADGAADVGTGTDAAAPSSERTGAVENAQERPDRATQRARELRRTLEEERRRREGAEARAVLAEARAAEMEAAQRLLENRSTSLERELSDAADAIRQAGERAERRVESRVAGLERDLAEERAALASLRREHERTRAELATARNELERLQAELDRAPAPVVQAASGRPLVLPPELDADTTAAAGWLAQRATLLLVDGYNVTLALRGAHPLEEQRRWLVERMRPLVVRGSALPIVIFDGDGSAGTRRDSSGVEVRFTATGTTADDEIVFAVAATADPVLVVTDDAELRERVRAEGGNVISTVHLLGAIDGAIDG